MFKVSAFLPMSTMMSSAYRTTRANWPHLMDNRYSHSEIPSCVSLTIQPFSIYARTVLKPTIPPFQLAQFDDVIVSSPKSTHSVQTNQSEQSMSGDETVAYSGYNGGRAANGESSVERRSSSSSTITAEVIPFIASKQFFDWESLNVHRPHIYVNERNSGPINPTLRKPRKPVSTKRSRAIEKLLNYVRSNPDNLDVSAVDEIFQQLVSTASLDPLSFQNQSRPIYGTFQGISQPRCYKKNQAPTSAKLNGEKKTVAETALRDQEKASHSKKAKKGRSKKSTTKSGKKPAADFENSEPAKKTATKKASCSKSSKTAKKTATIKPASAKKEASKSPEPTRKSCRRNSEGKQLPPMELAKSKVTKSTPAKPKAKATTKPSVAKKLPAKPKSSSPKRKNSKEIIDGSVVPDTFKILEPLSQTCVASTAATTAPVCTVPTVILKLKPATQPIQLTTSALQAGSKVAKPDSKPSLNTSTLKEVMEKHYQPILPKSAAEPTDQQLL